MADRPILFSGPMVRAILAGKKTQTRRLVGADDVVWFGWPCEGDRTPPHPARRCSAPTHGRVHYHCANGFHHGDLAPYADPGDRLWVKETHAVFDPPDGEQRNEHGLAYRASMKADGSFDYVSASGEILNLTIKRWTPSIFMRREYSRITLPVVAVRVERLRDITEGDAWAEGVASIGARQDPRGAYFELWDSINGERAPVESNPWVWVVAWKEAEVRRG